MLITEMRLPHNNACLHRQKTRGVRDCQSRFDNPHRHSSLDPFASVTNLKKSIVREPSQSP